MHHVEELLSDIAGYVCLPPRRSPRPPSPFQPQPVRQRLHLARAVPSQSSAGSAWRTPCTRSARMPREWEELAGMLVFHNPVMPVAVLTTGLLAHNDGQVATAQR